MPRSKPVRAPSAETTQILGTYAEAEDVISGDSWETVSSSELIDFTEPTEGVSLGEFFSEEGTRRSVTGWPKEQEPQAIPEVDRTHRKSALWDWHRVFRALAIVVQRRTLIAFGSTLLLGTLLALLATSLVVLLDRGTVEVKSLGVPGSSQGNHALSASAGADQEPGQKPQQSQGQHHGHEPDQDTAQPTIASTHSLTDDSTAQTSIAKDPERLNRAVGHLVAGRLDQAASTYKDLATRDESKEAFTVLARLLERYQRREGNADGEDIGKVEVKR